MQYVQRRLQRSVSDTRRSVATRPKVSISGPSAGAADTGPRTEGTPRATTLTGLTVIRSALGASTGTISLPSGISDTGISLRLASASGMPMIVIAIATAVMMCPIASHTPNSTISQMTLPTSAPGRAPGLVDDRAAERPQRVRARSAARRSRTGS